MVVELKAVVAQAFVRDDLQREPGAWRDQARRLGNDAPTPLRPGAKSDSRFATERIGRLVAPAAMFLHLCDDLTKEMRGRMVRTSWRFAGGFGQNPSATNSTRPLLDWPQPVFRLRKLNAELSEETQNHLELVTEARIV